MYSYCYVCSVLGIIFHCVVLCTVLLPPDVNPIAVNKYINTVCRLCQRGGAKRLEDLSIRTE